MTSLKTAFRNRAEAWNAAGPGGLDVSFEETEDLFAYTDVVVQSDFGVLDSDVGAQVDCTIVHATIPDACDQFRIFVNLDVMASESWKVKSTLACHELGHTMGLVHGLLVVPPTQNNQQNSLRCMRTPVVLDSGGGNQQGVNFNYGGGHNANAVNGEY